MTGIALPPDKANRSASEALADYDKGAILWTVEMGGIGPGYEQCIQVGAMELIRVMAGKPLPANDSEDTKEWGYPELSSIDQYLNLGLSGAQSGAIRSLAFRAIRDGWDAMVRSAPKNRRIQFSKAWPRPGP